MINNEISLNGEWQLCHYDEKDLDKAHIFDEKNAMPCKVPGDVHAALIENGLIENPFIGENIETLIQTEDSVWCYKKTFEIQSKEKEAQYLLYFESVDVNCSVYFNGILSCQSQNAFLPFSCDVSALINKGENEIIVVVDNGFHTICANKEIEKYDHKQWFGYGIDFKRIYLRKPQFCFRWDWAQRAITCGIAGDVTLRCVRGADITAFDIRSEIFGSTAALKVGFEADILSPVDYRIVVTGKDTLVVKNGSLTEIGTGMTCLSEILLEQPSLWWPNGMGEQHLYTIEIELLCGGESVFKAVKKHGVREIGLVEKYIDDTEGTGFTVTINGVPIFCKGANWVPAEALCGTAADERYKRLISEAKNANFNILRIWGGGRYEDDRFYEACDEAGILVWQDFMFANAYYPDDNPQFMENLNKELVSQIKRLRNYTCIAVWCGNNEIDWGYEIEKVVKEFFGESIYSELLPRLTQELDGTRIYRRSSPCKGSNADSRDGDNNTGSGDTHSWFFWLHEDEETALDYKGFGRDLSKFSAEYGVMSHPHLKSIREYTGKENITSSDKAFLVHNNLQENGRHDKLLLRYFCDSLPEDMQHYVLMSQLAQSSIYRYAIEHYRRRKPICSGSLFWMYNDCWGCTSWTIIDYFFRRKASYYAVKKAYAPLLVSVVPNDEGLDVFVVNDLLTILQNAELYVSVNFLDGRRVLEKTVRTDISENSSEKILSLDLNGIDRTEVFVTMRLKSESGKTLYENTSILAERKEMKLKNSNINCFMAYVSGGIQIDLESDYYASCVFIEDEADGEISENYFELPPFEKKSVFIETASGFDGIDVICLNQNSVKKGIIENEKKVV